MARKTAIPPLSRLKRTPGATAYSGLARRTLYRYAEDGLLTRYKIGAATYWCIDELDALVTRRAVA